MIRDTIKTATVTSMKAGDKERTATLRMVAAKIKDRDIELRTAAKQPDDDTLVIEVLQKMAKQRRESIQMYEDGGREELAAKERDELAVIREFLPQLADADATREIVKAAIEATGATSSGDVGKVMGAVMKQHKGKVDGNLARKLAAEALEG